MPNIFHFGQSTLRWLNKLSILTREIAGDLAPRLSSREAHRVTSGFEWATLFLLPNTAVSPISVILYPLVLIRQLD